MCEQSQNLKGDFLGFHAGEPEYPLARAVVLVGVQISREDVQNLSKMMSDFAAIAIRVNNAIIDFFRAFTQSIDWKSLQALMDNEDFQRLAKKNRHRARYERRYRRRMKYY